MTIYRLGFEGGEGAFFPTVEEAQEALRESGPIMRQMDATLEAAGYHPGPIEPGIIAVEVPDDPVAMCVWLNDLELAAKRRGEDLRP